MIDYFFIIINFIKTYYVVYICVGSSVAIITAMDADSGDFGKITYLLDRLSSQVSQNLRFL